jgi:Protein of unknown function (DUF3592)
MVRSSSVQYTVPPVFVAVFVTTIIGIVGALYFVGQQQKARDAIRQASWTVTSAQITETGWQTYKDRTWQGTNLKGWSGNYRYYPTINYSYLVNGSWYGQQRVEFKNPYANEWQHLSGPNGFHTRHPVGSAISIRYNPANPGESVLAQELK